jgi:hypothetical protein
MSKPAAITALARRLRIKAFYQKLGVQTFLIERSIDTMAEFVAVFFLA